MRSDGDNRSLSSGSARDLNLVSSGSVNNNGNTSNDARLLSQATTTATIAAKSIINSGGSETTALQTAKAAARSVLLSAHGTSIGNGPKGLLKRRKIKRQAEVVASMALVAATDGNNTTIELDSIGSPRGLSDHSQKPQSIEYEKNNHTRDSPFSFASPQEQQQQQPEEKSRLPPRPPTSADTTGSADNNASGGSVLPSVHLVNVESLEQEPLEMTLDPSQTYSEDRVRQVEIRVESQRNSKPPRKRQHKVVSHQLSREDPIYDFSDAAGFPDDETAEDDDEISSGTGGSDSYTHDDPLFSVISNSTEQAAGDDDGESTTSRKSFMTKNVDPLLFSFTNAFRCFPCSAGGKSIQVEDEYEDQMQLPLTRERTSTLSLQSNTKTISSKLSRARPSAPARNDTQQSESEDLEEPSDDSSVSTVQSGELLRGISDYQSSFESTSEEEQHVSHRHLTNRVKAMMGIQDRDDETEERDDNYSREDHSSVSSASSERKFGLMKQGWKNLKNARRRRLQQEKEDELYYE